MLVIIFRMIEFGFQIGTTIFIVLLLQISISNRTIENYLLTYINKAEQFNSVRELTSLISSSESLNNSDVQERSLDSHTQVSKKEASIVSVPASIPSKKNDLEPSRHHPAKSSFMYDKVLKQVGPLIHRKLALFSKIIPGHMLEPEIKKLGQDINQFLPEKNLEQKPSNTSIQNKANDQALK